MWSVCNDIVVLSWYRNDAQNLFANYNVKEIGVATTK